MQVSGIPDLGEMDVHFSMCCICFHVQMEHLLDTAAISFSNKFTCRKSGKVRYMLAQEYF